MKSNVKQAIPGGQVIWLVLLVVFGVTVDLWTKSAIFHWRGYPGQSPTWWVIDGYFGIETAVNIGAVFGLGAGKGVFFAVLSVVAAIGILIWLFTYRAIESWYLTTALGCVLGGIGGNLYDRLGFWYVSDIGLPEAWRSGVRDWILWQINDQWRWPNFNIADSLLVTGAVMMILHSFWVPVPSEEDPATVDKNVTSAGKQ